MALSKREAVFYKRYFQLHIPITLCIDSSVVLGEYTPKIFQGLVQWHIHSSRDFLLAERPLWLWWFVLAELIIQLPLFFYFVYQSNHFTNKDSTHRSLTRWLKLYGLLAAGTTFVCLYSIATRQNFVLEDKLQLMAIYLPTFIIPARLVAL